MAVRASLGLEELIDRRFNPAFIPEEYALRVKGVLLEEPYPEHEAHRIAILARSASNDTAQYLVQCEHKRLRPMK
jgi:hypothetical protein